MEIFENHSSLQGERVPLGQPFQSVNKFITQATASLLLLSALLITNLPSAHAQTSGKTYYVDFASGSNTNNGTSLATAWRTIPGTMSNCDTSSPAWLGPYGGGVVSQTNKVPAGTVFKLKPGTTYSGSLGGCIWINPVFYAVATATSPIKFELDTSQGAGTVTFNAAGLSPDIAFILVQTDGIQFDGKIASGILIENSPVDGLEVKEKAGTGAAVKDVSFKRLKFYNNGTSFQTDLAGSGSGQLNLRNVNGLVVDAVEFDGNSRFINGLIGGDDFKAVINATVSNSVAHDHRGDVSDNDAGIGFKMFNGQITFTNVSSYNNLKGFDLGEQRSNGVNISYKVINCLVYGNVWGTNFNGAFENGSLPANVGVFTWYLINNIIRDNTFMGSNIYSGPYSLYMVHNIYVNNGGGSSFDDANVVITPNGCNDTTMTRVYLYNNIFYKPNSANQNFMVPYVGDGSSGHITNYSIFSDYNSWVQKGSEGFVTWSAYGCSGGYGTVKYTYGTNGPGHASGSWFTQKDEPGSSGNGHLNADPHSKGTGASDSTLPPFKSVTNKEYTLTAPYRGLNLSTQPWFIPEMGKDGNGATRTSWDIGAYEFNTGTTTGPAAPTNLRIVSP